MRDTFVVAFYEIDRAWGGPEEGGWWFDCGQLVRTFRVAKSEDEALGLARRANDLLHVLQRNCCSVGSVLYDGGRYEARVYSNTAPAFFPETVPHYE